MPTTTARNYFEQYTGTDAVALLQSLPSANPKAFENEWLDFKSGRAIADSTNLEKIWSKAVGAFANNEGGVLIFGIQADKDKVTGIDAANAVELVPDVNWLVSKLTEFSRFATDPPLTGIEFKALAVTGAQGFVVCLVPEGKTKPYRSEKAERRFYLRIGDSAREPSLSLLRQLFYPQFSTRARLEMRIDKNPFKAGSPFSYLSSLPDVCRIEFDFYNVGNTTIEQANFVILCTGGLKIGHPPRAGVLQYQNTISYRLPEYLHPSHSGYYDFYATPDGSGQPSTFVATVYQRNTPAITRNFAISFRTGQIQYEDKLFQNVSVPYTAD